MEHKQLISDALIHSPPSNLSFQADKFTRKSNRLSIPDTIHEQAELSGDSTKMEASCDLTKASSCDEKENVNNNQQVASNESSDNSKIIAIDNSFIKNCERKLLENSNSEEEKPFDFENKSAVNKQLLEIPRLVPSNDTISTPPSALRKEISILRNELAAADEFHDFEIQVLKEEKSHNEVDLQDYLQVVEKNAALIELYTSLKNEYDEYRKEQEKMRNELQSKTADCLESLCSQIEASDNSLNFSSTSLISFNAGIKSSTMMDDISEVEATVMHDATVLTSDPLSITVDSTFKTPFQTPLKSAKKLLPQQLNWSNKISDVREVNIIIDKCQNTMPLDSEYNIQLLNLETTLCDKLKEVESLEQRLFKVEDMSNVLKSECERAREILSKKTEQLSELTQKLFTETISLNPALGDSLIDAPGPKLLFVFIETIMEKCKSIQDELIQKHNCEKTEWEAQRKIELTAIENLQNQIKSLNERLSYSDSKFADLEVLKLDLERKLTAAEHTILTREVEMRILQTNLTEAREDFTSSAEALLKLESQLSLTQAEKNEIENRCQELEDTVGCLRNELESKEKLIIELDTTKTIVTNIQKENEDLKQIIQRSEEIIAHLQTESSQEKEGLLQEIEWLRNKEASRFSILIQGLEDFKKSIAENSETHSGENAALNFLYEKLKECADPQLLSAMEAVMECAKIDFDSKRKSDLIETENLQNQIKVADEKYIELEAKMSEILSENNEFNKLCEDLKKQLLEAGGINSKQDEEITRLKREVDVLEKLKDDLALLEDYESNDSFADRVRKLITEIPDVQKDIETGETKIVSVFVETLTKTCKGFQNEFIKKIENKKLEWESQRNIDLDLIDTLQVKLKTLSEKSSEQEMEISKVNLEKEDLKELHNNLMIKMTEAQTIISTNNEEIENLRSHEITLKQTKDELAVANETILTLKSHITSIESVKTEVETRCQGLQETIADLELALDSNASLRSAMDAARTELEFVRRENEKLRETNEQSSKVIDRLKSESYERNAQELLEEIDSLRSREKSRFSALFEILEDGKKMLKEIVTSDLTEHSGLGLISEKLRESVDSEFLSAVEAIADFIKMEFDNRREKDLAHIENLQNQIKSLTEKSNEYEIKFITLINENNEFKKLCENLKVQLNETESLLSLRKEEISILKKQEDVLKEMKDTLALADDTISKLNSQLSLIEEEKKEVENRCQELEDTVGCLRNELESKEKLRLELDTTKIIVTNIQKENEDLKQIIQRSEEIIAHLQTESSQEKEGLLQEIEWLRNKEASRFSIIFQGLEDFKKSIAENSETHSGENAALNFLYEKLKECADPQLLSAMEAVMECAKIDFDSKRKSDLTETENLQNQIKVADEKYIELEAKMSEILGENNEFSKLCEDLKKQLLEAGGIIALRDEEILRLKREVDVLKKLKDDLALLEDFESNDSFADRVRKLVTEIPDVQKDIETEETKIVSVFVETLTKTCKGFQNEFIKKIENKKLEWESQRNIDLDLIDTLQVKLKTLSEKSSEQEMEISKVNLEKEDLKKLHNNLMNQITEAQAIISTHNEEIENLRSHEITLKQTKDELSVANETILTLKSQLVSTESQKVEIELRCRKLEESAVNFQAEMETKETIIKGLDELREKMENENNEVRRKIQQSEDIILHLKRGLESANEEQSTKELRIKDLLNDIHALKKEKENLLDFSEKLEKLEKSNRNLMDIFSDVQSHLDLPEDTMTKLLSGNLENKKILSEKINNLVKTQSEELRGENKNLKLSNENLKEKVKQLTRLLCESANVEIKEELSNLNASHSNSMTLRSRSSKNIDLFMRRLDKVEDMNHNLTELLTEMLTLTEFPDLEKLKLSSARNFSVISKKVIPHIKGFVSRLKELKEENAQLDEECETYSNIIKSLKKEATAVWRTNEEKTEAMQSEISRMKEEKALLEKEKQELLTKISRLEAECQRLKSASRTEGPLHSCNCMNESKKVNDLKRALLIREQKLLELQDLEAQASSYKSQIEYLKSALEREKKKVAEEKDKIKKLQNELDEATKHQKSESKKDDQNEILEELRMRGSLNGGVVQEFVDKEKMRKLSKDIGILKELCRARYVEIKRLEAVNASLRNKMPKNSNQMDSPIRSRGYVTRSKNAMRETWKTESNGKENSPMCAERLY